MKRIRKFLHKAGKTERAFFKFRLLGIGLLIVGLAIAISGNMLGSTAGTIILLVGLGIAGIGGAMAGDGLGI